MSKGKKKVEPFKYDDIIEKKSFDSSDWVAISEEQFKKEVELEDAINVLKKTKRVKTPKAIYIIQ